MIMKASFRFLLSTVLCLSIATAGSAAATERSDLRERLVAQGVEAEQAEARVAALTDEEAELLAAQFDELPAGGDPRGLFGLLAFAAVVYVVIKLLPLILIGGGAAAAIKASNRGA
jgi:hypothetical protein